MAHARLSVWVDGRVQGVGFRYWARARAVELGLNGSATNLADGRVLIVAEGPQSALAELLASLRDGQPPGWVSDVVHTWSAPEGEPTGFRVG